MGSKICPEVVQTAVVKGWRDREQKLKGRRVKGRLRGLEDGALVPDPELAEKDSPEAHSECVM